MYVALRRFFCLIRQIKNGMQHALFWRWLFLAMNCVATSRVYYDTPAINFNKLLMLSCFFIDSILSFQKYRSEAGSSRPVAVALNGIAVPMDG